MNWARLYDALILRAPEAMYVHLLMVGISIGVAIAISIPIGILLTRPRFKKLGLVVISLLNLLQTVPALAIVALAMPILGMGLKPSICALVAQGLLPIARNTIAGLYGVKQEVKDAAKGMGMPPLKVLIEVELPLALPVVLAGVRTSCVFVVSVGTLAAYIGGGGLGDLILIGLNMLWSEFLLVGAGLGALLAISLDRMLSYLEYKITSVYQSS